MTTGIIGTALASGLGRGLLGNLFGNNGWNNGWNNDGGWNGGCGWNNGCGCHGAPSIFSLQEKECEDNLTLTRAIYDGRLRDIAELNAFRERDVQEKFNLYQNDNANYNKLVERISELEKREAVAAAVEPYRTKIIFDAIDLERERRCCADNQIVDYLNGNFQPLYVADMTPAATSTERLTYNPLKSCACSCNNR